MRHVLTGFELLGAPAFDFLKGEALLSDVRPSSRVPENARHSKCYFCGFVLGRSMPKSQM